MEVWVGRAAVVDHDVAGGQDHLRHALADQVDLGQQRGGRVGQRGQARGGLREQRRQRAQLALGQPRLGLRDPGVGGVDRRGRLSHAGQDLQRERARGRERPVQRVEGVVGVDQGRRQQADARRQVVRLGSERAGGDVEVGDQALERGLVAAERAGDLAEGRHELGEVVGRAAEQGLVDDRRVLQRRDRVVEGLVQRLGGGEPPDVGVLLGVLRRRRRLRERAAVDPQHVLELGPGVGLKRGQDLVELDRGGRLSDADCGAVVNRGAVRRAGPQVDEEVALEEDPRADLHGGVPVDRQRLVLELHRHHGVVGVLVARDPGHLADVDAGDPHRRVLADRDRRREHALHAEPVREGDVLGEAEVDQDHGHDEDARPDRQRAASRAVLAQASPVGSAAEVAHPFFAPLLVFVPLLPGALPMIVCPGT